MFLILLAAGKSKRFENTIPKQYTKLGNKTILEHSLDAIRKNSTKRKVTSKKKPLGKKKTKAVKKKTSSKAAVRKNVKTKNKR